jgi:enamine deaminase RidA (YjgF/YER057c/UK114 family)
MARRLISSGSTFEADMGYSRAVVDGEWVFVSGTTGFDYRTMTLAEGVVAQAEQCFRNIEAALTEAARVSPTSSASPTCCPTLRIRRLLAGDAQALRRGPAGGDDDLGGLADPRMKIEIEVTARKRSG